MNSKSIKTDKICAIFPANSQVSPNTNTNIEGENKAKIKYIGAEKGANVLVSE